MSNLVNGSGRPLVADKVALECYRAIVCTKAICCSQTGLITYFEVQDGLGLSKENFGKMAPIQGHLNINGKGDYDIRVVWVPEAGGEAQPAGDTHDRISVKGRDRFGATALRLPPSPGVWSLALEWRHPNEIEWRTSIARCPIVFEQLTAMHAPQARA